MMLVSTYPYSPFRSFPFFMTCFLFFNATATPEIYTLSLHDALPILNELAVEAIGLEKSYGAVRVLSGLDLRVPRGSVFALLGPNGAGKTTTVRILSTLTRADAGQDRKSTRLNSSHLGISYAVFCLKK